MKWSKTKWEIHVIGLLIARCVIYGTSPLGVAFFIAAYVEEIGSALLLAEVMLGAALVLSYVEGIKYGLILLVVLILSKLFIKEGDKRSKIIPMAALTGSATMLISLGQLLWEQDIVFYSANALLEGIIVFAATIVYQRGIIYLKNQGRDMVHEEAVGVGLIVLTFLLGMPSIMNQYFSLIEICCYFITIYVAYCYGIKEGGMIGTICGAVLAYQYGDVGLLGVMTLIGMGSSVLRNLGRLGSVIGFAITAVFVHTFYPGFLLEQQSLIEMGASGLVFLVLPKAFVHPVIQRYGVKNGDQVLLEDAVWISTKNQLKEFSEAFKRLQSTLENVPEDNLAYQGIEKEKVLDRVVQAFCGECSNCDACWQQKQEAVYQDAVAIFGALEREDGLQVKDIPQTFGETCIHLENFLMEAHHSFELAKLEHIWNNRILEGREAIAGQLGEVAKIIDNFSLGLYEEIQIDEKKEAAIVAAFKSMHVKVKKVVMLTNHQGKDDIYVTARSTKGRMMTTREASIILGKALDKKMKVQDGNKVIIGKDYEVISFTEDETYYYLQGVCRSTKQDEIVSGDNFSFMPLQGGQLIMMLADGMGSGKEASKESETIIEMLEKMLLAGFSGKSAIQLLNAVLAGPIDRPVFSTLDFAMINLYTGMCEFAKIGASTTFIIRDDWIEMIASASLPMGIFPKMEYESCVKKLYDGDIIIMISDGIMEAVPGVQKEENMKALIESLDLQNPKEIADAIMSSVKENSEETNKDDMTVIALGIWKK